MLTTDPVVHLRISERSTKNFEEFHLFANFGTINSIILKDCIRNTTAVCNPRQNSVKDKFSLRQNSVQDKYSLRQNSVWKFFFRLLEKNSCTEFCLELHFVLDWICLRFPVWFFELSRTFRCLSSLSGMYIPQLSQWGSWTVEFREGTVKVHC